MTNDNRSDDQVADQAAMGAKAVATKQSGEEASHHPSADDLAGKGMQSLPREDYPPSGAFDAEGQRPVLERSRKKR